VTIERRRQEREGRKGGILLKDFDREEARRLREREREIRVHVLCHVARDVVLTWGGKYAKKFFKKKREREREIEMYTRMIKGGRKQGIHK